MISPSSTATLPETKAGSGCLTVVEIHTRGWAVSGVGDGEVNTDLKSRYLSSIHGVSCFLCVLSFFKIDEGKSSRPFSGAVQHHLDLLKLSEPPELFIKVRLASREIQTKHSQAFGGCRIFPVSLDFGWPRIAPGLRPGS